MINIKKINCKKEYAQCFSCLKDIEETDIFKIKIGKTNRQIVSLKLCQNCLMNLGDQIFEIYQRMTDFINEE